MPAPPATRSPSLPWTQADMDGVLELSALQTLHDLDPRDGLAFLREYLQMFHGTLEPALQKMRQCQAAQDRAGLAFEAHKLQSAVAHLGARPLAAACKALTASASDDTPGGDGDAQASLVADVVARTAELQRTLARLVQA